MINRAELVKEAIKEGYKRLEELEKEIEAKKEAEKANEHILTDVNGVEMKTGDVVEIKNAYFKSDNGLYVIEHTPGDPSWIGTEYSLRKLNKNGTLSKSKYNICFWPITCFVNDMYKTAAANEWNAKHATIEVTTVKNTTAIVEYFKDEADKYDDRINWNEWNFGEDNKETLRLKACKKHYEAVAARIA